MYLLQLLKGNSIVASSDVVNGYFKNGSNYEKNKDYAVIKFVALNPTFILALILAKLIGCGTFRVSFPDKSFCTFKGQLHFSGVKVWIFAKDFIF